jgi:radical SAM superfamily enzyme YgiQ (UPF0313 family)
MEKEGHLPSQQPCRTKQPTGHKPIFLISSFIGGDRMQDNALLIHPRDNVVVTLRNLAAGDEVIVKGVEKFPVSEDIPASHKIALRDIPEGEEIIRQIVTGVPYKDIRGLSYRENGGIVHNEIHPLPDITHIPFPDRSLRKHDYCLVKHGVRLTSHTFDTILTTRGCPFKCKFCTFSLNPLGQKRSYTERPVESVIEELKTVTADVVLFSDDNFFTNPKRSEQLCDLIIENKIKKIFVVQARIDIARHPRILDKAEKAGFKIFLIGIESPHDRILKQLDKGITQQQVRDAFAVLTQYDFYLHGYFIYGNIGETEEEMLYIPKFAKEIKLDSISFQKLRIEKFSPLKEVVEETPGYYYNRIGGSVYSDRYGRKELKQIRNRIRSEFYDLPQVIHIIRKARRIGLVSGRDLTNAFFKLPLLMYGLARRKARKKIPDPLQIFGYSKNRMHAFTQ